MYGARRRDGHSNREPSPPRTGDPVPVAAMPLDESDRRRPLRARTDSSADRIPRRLSSPIFGPRTRRASAWPTPSAACSNASLATAVSWSTTRRIRPPSRWSATCSARELSSPGQTAQARGCGGRRPDGPRVSRAGADVRSGRASRCSGSIRMAGGRSRIATAASSSTTSRRAAALAREAVERPAAFSPGVLLRPIVQDTIFPTVCYVAGPNELAYLGQLRGSTSASACRCR